MSPLWKSRLLAGASAVLAVWLGRLAAEGHYALPSIILVACLAAVLVRLVRLPADVILLGLLLFGYLVGNRGFAQLMPVPGLPVFPAELGLLVGVTWLVVQSALRRQLPWRGDLLNWAVLLWLVAGTARVCIDAPRYGLLAIRDYAMVYYSLFFFLAQHYASTARARSYLVGSVVLGTAILLPVYFLFLEFPLFFLFKLTVRGVPLIYLKWDLAVTFLAAGSILTFHWARIRHRPWAWPLATAMFLTVATSNSRASLIGAAMAIAWLLIGRRWTFPILQSIVGSLVLALVAMLAFSGNVPWAQVQLARLQDRVTSIVDVGQVEHAASAETANKLDNNRFRLVWWRTVLQETRDQGPVFGLGFGYDLAAGFIQTYDPAMSDEFVTRSPHSIVMSAIGRMGAVGLAVLLLLAATMAGYTWREARRRPGDSLTLSLWCAAWVIFVSACFGVVLEGPMGAVVFWSLLGLANGTTAEKPEATSIREEALAESSDPDVEAAAPSGGFSGP